MKKLWQTSQNSDPLIEAYTVGDDPRLDVRLLPYEAYGSLAHAAGLAKIGVLTKKDLADLRKAFSKLLDSDFTIAREQEDVHTAVEQALGELGKKIHAGRSRNDQVQTDLRLYLKDALLSLIERSLAAAANWEAFAKRHQEVPLPGYTHLQKGMPTTVGHWAASHAEALIENARSLKAAYDEADCCPLGSAAGYGATLKLDRAFVAKLLGFSRVQRNTLRVQTSRPRVEAAAVSACALLARDLGVLSWDLSLYCTAEFGFFTLDRAFTTGSSLMPQKKNPDVIELTRGRAALFPGWVSQILALGQLPSGYHRDYQLTKGVLMSALDTAAAMLDVCARLPKAITVDAAKCKAAITKDMLATHEALRLVQEGTPFREAYRKVADEARSSKASAQPAGEYTLPDYPGAPGNPDLPSLAADRSAQSAWAASERKKLSSCWSALL